MVVWTKWHEHGKPWLEGLSWQFTKGRIVERETEGWKERIRCKFPIVMRKAEEQQSKGQNLKPVEEEEKKQVVQQLPKV